MPNTHIIFDDSSSSSTGTSTSSEEDEIDFKIAKIQQKQILQLTLTKRLSDESFGFEVRGDMTQSGHHFIESIKPNSAADRAGLLNNDKIIKINNQKVENLNAQLLINKLESETNKNKYKLNLTISRENQTSNQDNTTNASFLNLKKRFLSFSEDQESEEKEQSKSKKTNTTSTIFKIVAQPTISYDKIDQTNLQPALLIEQSFNTDLPPSLTLAQLRQDKIDQIKFNSPQRPFKRANVPNRTILDTKAFEIQQKLSEQGKYVLWQEIIYELLNQYENCQHIGDLGLQQADNLTTIYELIRLQRRIDTFIISYESRLPCVCLIDLEKAICSDYNYSITNTPNKMKITRFEELFLGPLIRNQVIRQIFNLNADIKSIEQLKPVKLSSLLKNLENYLNENDLWSSKKIKQTEFEAYLLTKLKVKSMSQLACKINNIGMLIGSMKNVQYTYAQLLNEIKTKFIQDYDTNLNQQINQIIQNLNHNLIELNSNYFNKSSLELIDEFLSFFDGLFNKIEQTNISLFLKSIRQCSYLRDCLQLALCIGKNDLDKTLTQMEINKSNDYEMNYTNFNQSYYWLMKRVFYLVLDKTSSTREIKRFLHEFLLSRNLKLVCAEAQSIKFNDSNSETSSEDTEEEDDDDDEEMKTTTFQPTQEELSSYLKTKFEPYFTLQFEHLIQLENDLLQLNSNQTSFIQFLNKNKHLFEQNQLELNLLGSNVNNEYLKKLRSNIKHHVNEIYKNITQDTDIICSLICKHYKLSTFDDLNLNCAVIDLIESDYTNKTNVYYLDSIFSSVTSNRPRIDLTIKETKDLFIQKLIKCPLLDNIEQFMSIHFNLDSLNLKQTLNDLNLEQIQLDNEIFQFDCLDLGSDCLLKLTRKTDIDLLKKSIESNDYINTLGHLVSLIAVKYKTIARSPKSLIVNEIESSLSNLAKSHDLNQFVSNLICRLPFKLVVLSTQFIFDFILGPLSKVTNNNQIKYDLFEFLANTDQFDKIEYFCRIGKVCSINEWSKNSLKTAKSKQKDINQIKPPKFSKIDEFQPQKTDSDVSIKQVELKIQNRNDEISNEFDHVRSIRKKFGIDIHLDENTRRVTEHVKGVLGRSLESLSNELYNKDMHFVLELIQNADDNTYATSQPSLIFLIEPNRISLFNNEIGFKRQNIDAICDVKASTKGKHQHGYIGRKGIGFKSVFTVTDRPEIHSNGYHVKFDLNNGHIGYILPNWISDTTRDLFNLVSIRLNALNLTNLIGDLNTCIQLPLKSESEMQRHKSSLLTNNFNDIKPYLLLFLNRLKYLILINSNQQEKIYFRNDLNENLIEIKTIESNTINEQKWLVVKESLQVPDNLKPNETVDATDLCLAFPIDYSHQQRYKMDVFAYLPLRSFGFNFIIQADFVVPASRQDINEDNEWNQWIIKQIPNLFIKSFNHFKHHFNDDLIALKAYFNFIPLEDEILGCFSHIPRQINDLLRNESFLPALDTNGGLVYKKPFECLLLKDHEDLIRQVLTSDLLKQHLGRYYVHPAILSANSHLLNSLGVRYLNLNDLTDLVESVFMNSNSNLEDIKSTAKWLVLLQYCLKNNACSIQQETKLLDKIKQIKFIPVRVEHECKFVSLNESDVFFSNGFNLNKLDIEIEHYLHVIDEKSLFCLDEIQNQQILTILKKLAVNQQQPNEIFNHFLKRVAFQDESTHDLNVLFLVYCHKYSQQIDLIKLKDLIKIKTNLGFVRLTDKSGCNRKIYLSTQYGNKYDLIKLFSSYDWCLIDSVYLNKSIELANKKVVKENDLMLSWRQFLLQLGLYDLFTPDLIDSNDYKCAIVDKLISNQINDELLNLFKILDENWEHTSILTKPYSYYKYINNKETIFFTTLKTSKWIRVETNQFYETNNQSLDLKTIQTLETPENVYLKEQTFLKYYGLSVPYANQILSKSQLARELSFHYEFNKINFIKTFVKWTTFETNHFHASILQMRNIYKLISTYLNENEPNVYDILNEMIQLKKSFIFIPNAWQKSDFVEKVYSGKFYSNEQVYWCDPTGLFLKYSKLVKKSPILLDQIYSHKMEETFIDLFQIKQSPGLIDYINLLEQIILLNASLEEVYLIFEILVDKSTKINRLDLINMLKTKQIIPCFNNQFVSLQDNPLLVDNIDLAEHFSNKLNLVAVPCGDQSSFYDSCQFTTLNVKQTYFLSNLLNLKLFSNEVILDLENITENLREAPSHVSSLCSKLLPLIQCFIYHRSEFKKTYSNLKQNLNKLLHMKFYSVNNLQNIYRCKHDSSIKVVVSSKTCLDTNQLSIYWKYFIRQDLLNNTKDIIRGYLKLFTSNLLNEKSEKDLVNFCLLMYQFNDLDLVDEDKREIEKDYKIKLDLPDDETKWLLKDISTTEVESTRLKIETNQIGKKLKGVNKIENVNQRLVYEQISQSQINLPKNDNLVISEQRLTSFNANMTDLANKMSTNFNLQLVNQRPVLPFNNKVTNLDWSNEIITSLKEINSLSRSSDYIVKIGRWGELWVNEMLKKQYENELSNGEIRIEWVNEINESGLPYDFRLISQMNSDDVKYIEVKTTTRMNQEAFPISYNELLFAQNYSDKFHIYRLYNAGVSDPNNVEFKIVSNIPSLLNSHGLNLFIVI